MGNLFIYYYENKWVSKVKKVDLNKASGFVSVFRFTDDLTALNDGGEFEHSYNENSYKASCW